MKLKLNRTLRAALIAAITAVGFTLSQAQAADILSDAPFTNDGQGNYTQTSNWDNQSLQNKGDSFSNAALLNIGDFTTSLDVGGAMNLNQRYDAIIGSGSFTFVRTHSGNGNRHTVWVGTGTDGSGNNFTGTLVVKANNNNNNVLLGLGTTDKTAVADFSQATVQFEKGILALASNDVRVKELVSSTNVQLRYTAGGVSNARGTAGATSFNDSNTNDKATASDRGTVTVGKLTMSGTTVGNYIDFILTGTGSTISGSTFGTGDTITVGADAGVTFSGAITLASSIKNSGTVTFNNATVTMSCGLNDLDGVVTYSDENNGFVTGATKYVVSNSGEGSSSGLNQVTIGSTTYDLVNGAVQITEADYSTYFLVTNGSSVDVTAQKQAHQEFENVVVESGITGTLNIASNTSLSTLSVGAGATATVALSGDAIGAGSTVNIDNLTNNGVLDIGTGATVNLTASEYSVGSGQTFKTTGEGLLTLTTLKVAGGTLDIASSLNVTGGGDGKDGNNSKGLHLSGDGATVNINGGTTTVTGAIYTNANNISLNVGTDATDAKLVTRRLEIGDRNGGSASFHIGQHGTVVITGNEDYRQDTSNPQKKTSLQLAEWNQVVNINIEGNLYAKDATAFMSNDTSSTIAVNGGTMAVKGIATNNSTSDRAHTFTMTGGKVVLGELGIAAEPGSWTITLNSGEIGMYSDTTVVGRNANIAGAVTFNTAKYTWDGSGASLELKDGEAGGTMTVSGSLTGTGTITKTGAGTLVLSGTANAISNTINLQAGTLNLTGAFTLDNMQVQGEQIDYIGGAGIETGSGFKQASGTLNLVSIGTGATLTVDDGATFTRGGSAVTVNTETGIGSLAGTPDYTALWINSATTVSYTAAQTIADEHDATVGTVYLNADGSTITMDKADTSIALVLKSDASATVNATAATTVTALTGAGKLVVSGTETVTLLSTSGYTGAYEVGSGATIEIINANMADVGNLTVAGEGTVRLVTTRRSEDSNALGTLTAPNLELADNSDHTGRYYYGGSSSIAGVGNLKFAGGQLWLTSDMTYGGGVTFGTTTYTESNDFSGAAMRVNASGTFNGAVDVQGTAKLVWGESNKTLAFNNTVTGSGNIDLIGWNGKTGTFTIAGDASAYAGAMTTNDKITLNVTSTGRLSIGSGSSLAGAVTLDGALTVSGDEASSISGVISGSGSLTKNGAGTLTLSGANTYTGDTVINAGTVKASNDSALGSAGAVTIAEDAALEVEAALSLGGRLQSSGSITVNEGRSLTLTSGSTIYQTINNAGTVSLTGVTLGDGFEEQGGGIDYYDLAGNKTTSDANHYEGTGSTYVQVVSGGTATGSDIQWKGQGYNLENDGTIIVGGGTPTYDTFFVVDEIDASTIAAGAHYGDTQTIDVGDWASLNMDAALEGKNIVTHVYSYITGDNVSPEAISLAAGSVTFFPSGVTTQDGITFSGLMGVGMSNLNEDGEPVQYSTAADSIAVQADVMTSNSDTDVTVANNVDAVSIVNNGAGKLVLTNVYLGENASLTSIAATTGDITLQNVGVNPVELADLTIGAGTTVAVYQGDELAPNNEGTITITDTLTGGSATLLANLTLKGGSTLDVDGGHVAGGAMNALTLGSKLTFDLAPNSLVNLDQDTIEALAGLSEGQWLDLIVAADGTQLDYVGAETGMSYDQLFRAEGLTGPYTVYANAGSFGLVKGSQVPEPTTGTLSLLALAALAARRRRK